MTAGQPPRGRRARRADRRTGRAGPRVQHGDGRLAARERLVERGEVRDHDRQDAEAGGGVEHLERARERVTSGEPFAVALTRPSPRSRSPARIRATGRTCEPPAHAGTRSRASGRPPTARDRGAARTGRTSRAACRRSDRAGGARRPARSEEVDRDAPSEQRVALDAPRQQEREEDLEQHQRHEHATDDADHDPHPAGTIRDRRRYRDAAWARSRRLPCRSPTTS